MNAVLGMLYLLVTAILGVIGVQCADPMWQNAFGLVAGIMLFGLAWEITPRKQIWDATMEVVGKSLLFYCFLLAIAMYGLSQVGGVFLEALAEKNWWWAFGLGLCCLLSLAIPIAIGAVDYHATRMERALENLSNTVRKHRKNFP